uniref:ATP binding protein n=1 Tax=Cucumis melo subsp. melo TaxID=412675 RepID=E5GBD7_CUCME|nr:ATP binding protein [Cucumis melo subsp. melo]
MEQKHIFLSALGVGVGVGVGLGLSSGQAVGKWVGGNGSSDEITGQKIEQELIRQLLDGKNSNVTFAEFPYYLRYQPVCIIHQSIESLLLVGSKKLEVMAKLRLILCDVSDFSLKMQSKYGCPKKESLFRRSISEVTLERMSSVWGSFSILPTSGNTRGNLRRQSSTTDIQSRCTDSSSNLPKLRRNASAASDISSISSNYGSTNSASAKRTNTWCFDEKLFLQSLYKVLVSVSETSSIILYLRDVERLLLKSQRMYNLFHRFLNKLSGSVLVLGSRMVDVENDCGDVDDRLTNLFRYSVEIRPPEDENHLVSWKAQLEEDMKMIQFQDNKNHIAEVLAANDLECDDLGSICHADTMVLSNYIEEIVVSAISYHLMNNRDPEYRNGKLLISSKSLSHGLSIFQEGNSEGKDTLKLETNAESSKEAQRDEAVGVKTESKSENPAAEAEKSVPIVKKDVENVPPQKAPEIPPDNEFEKRIRPEVIPANEIGVTFADIGAMDEIKESLQELVMLPLRRPDLFKGGLLKPCRGILLFGPPGTAKVSPTIIFVDEVDSMLGQRTRVGEHEAMRKIKNEFMSHWDGLLTRNDERILVLAATNRPFDLDEAIIRRFERRIMVGLPSVESRELILRTLLSKEKAEDLDFKELATMTEGYSGSDLKNLCVTAAYRPVRELLQQERLKDLEKKQRERKEKEKEEEMEKEKQKEEKETETKNETGNENEKKEKENNSEEVTGTKETEQDKQAIILRHLNMDDMRQAKNQVAASFASEGSLSCSYRFRMSNPLERYHKLSLIDSLGKSYSYPLACKELSFLIRGAFIKLPKNLQSLIYQHIITAFHLLPE